MNTEKPTLTKEQMHQIISMQVVSVMAQLTLEEVEKVYEYAAKILQERK